MLPDDLFGSVPLTKTPRQQRNGAGLNIINPGPEGGVAGLRRWADAGEHGVVAGDAGVVQNWQVSPHSVSILFQLCLAKRLGFNTLIGPFDYGFV